MKTIYIDQITFQCHLSQNAEGTRIPYATDAFDGKCDTLIEGYRFVPSGESWKREDGVTFHGEMISPWKNYSELDAAQREYEKEQLTEYKESLLELGVEV